MPPHICPIRGLLQSLSQPVPGDSVPAIDGYSACSGLKANVIRNLLEYVELVEALGEGCSQAQEITTAGVIDKQVSDGPFALTATATSGLPVSYELIYGPASLSGSTATLDGTAGIVKIIASQDGDSTWCEAASKTVFISVGDNVPAAPGTVAAFGTDTTTVEVSWIDNSTNETLFRIENREVGQLAWEVAGFVGPGATSYAVNGLDSGVTYEFQVIAQNQVAEWPRRTQLPELATPRDKRSIPGSASKRPRAQPKSLLRSGRFSHQWKFGKGWAVISRLIGVAGMVVLAIHGSFPRRKCRFHQG